ncbi:MAG: sodium/solute symporter [Pseudomonadota bacterium]
MHALDWILIAAYAAAMMALSAWLGRRQESEEDYYVAGRSLPWWATGLSTMATQTSAISFISVPAFVALAPNGGLVWLQYELAVPLAMVGVSLFLLPFLRGLELITVYEYLERRFGSSVRVLCAGVFLLSRGLATGVALYASALVLMVLLDAPLWLMIVAMGLFTLLYDLLGGIRAVVWSDVIQMAILGLGLVFAIAVAIGEVGGVGAVVAATDPDRLVALRPGLGYGDEPMPFWGFFIGGLFLYMAYYGTDQSQVQRELASRGPDHTRRSLALNGFARLPLTLAYALMGLAIGAVVATTPALAAAIPAGRPDAMVPTYILTHLPIGIRGLLVAALLSAAMSSLDSAFNALSATTMRDFIERNRPLERGHALRLSRLTTLAWGLFAIAFAFAVESLQGTVLETINRIGSAFYGPVLAAFLVGVLSPHASGRGVFIGVLAGVGTNVFLWLAVPELFWMWWNAIGLVVAGGVALLLFRRQEPAPPELLLRGRQRWAPVYTLLVLYCGAMLGLLWALPRIAAAI